jgi:drug/metabolite transporter (DMT)-like permease
MDDDDRLASRSTPVSIVIDAAEPHQRHNDGVNSANRSRPSTVAVAIALLIVYVVWGSTYLGIAVMIETLPPLLAAGVRYAAAGLIMLGAVAAHARFRRRATPAERPTAANWRAAFIVGSLLLLGGNGGVVLAEQFIPSGVAAVLVATMPIWLAVFDAILSRRRPSGLVIGGLIAGITGVVILLAPVEGVDELDPFGIGLVIAATISWAVGSLYARRAPLPRSPLLGTGLEMLTGGIALLVAGSMIGEIGRTNVDAFSLRSLVALAYLIVFGSLVAFTAFTWLLANVPVSTVGTYAYVNPIVAVALGAVLLSEPITPRTLIAAAIIIGAVVAMVSGRPREAERAGPVPEAASLEPD